MVNTVCGTGSTGRICLELARRVRAQGGEAAIAYGRGTALVDDVKTYRIGRDLDVWAHGLLTRLLDAQGFGSRRATEKLVAWIREYDPDVIHLHNLHGYYLHLGILFEALADLGKPILWTLHDCWAFTGHCTHYESAGCGKWETGCFRCGQKGAYPASRFLDGSRRNYQKKKRLFTMPKHMVLVTPSLWLAGEVKRSFLGGYPVRTLYNGIDGKVFHPVESGFTGFVGIKGRKIALSVANVWDEHKGLDTLLRLPELLGEDWQVVLVGLTERQMASLPPRVVGIGHLDRPEDLARWYVAADVYVQASRGESMGMAMAEAISCGTPVAAFDATATAEILGKNGIAVASGDGDALAEAVRLLGARGKEPYRVDCGRFEAGKQYEGYLQLYRQMKENGYDLYGAAVSEGTGIGNPP